MQGEDTEIDYQPTMVPNHQLFPIENAEEQGEDETTDDRPFKCQHCPKGFRQKGHLVYHLHTHSATYDFECDDCEAKFMTPAKLLRHQRNAHSKASHAVDFNGEFYVERKGTRKSYTCKRCGKYFLHVSSARSHSWMHSGTRPYKCHYCQKGFRQSGHLICHVREFHSGISENRVCTICLKDFRSKQTFDLHMKNKHSDLIEDCSQVNSRVSQVSSEISPRDTNANETQENGTSPYCNTSVESSRTAFSVDEMKSLPPENAEEVCSNSDGAKYQEEAATLDSSKAKKKCSADDQHTMQIAPIKMENDFDNVEPAISILDNGLSFSFSPPLLQGKRHFSVKIVGNRRHFECKLCSKVFFHVQAAKNHGLIHAGIKPYRCNVCSQTFRQRSHVVCHMHRHAKHFACKYCDKVFTTSTKLKRHAREIHHLDKASLMKMMATHVEFLKYQGAGDVRAKKFAKLRLKETSTAQKNSLPFAAFCRADSGSSVLSRAYSALSDASTDAASINSAVTEGGSSCNYFDSDSFPRIVSVESRADATSSHDSRKGDSLKRYAKGIQSSKSGREFNYAEVGNDKGEAVKAATSGFEGMQHTPTTSGPGFAGNVSIPCSQDIGVDRGPCYPHSRLSPGNSHLQGLDNRIIVKTDTSGDGAMQHTSTTSDPGLVGNKSIPCSQDIGVDRGPCYPHSRLSPENCHLQDHDRSANRREGLENSFSRVNGADQSYAQNILAEKDDLQRDQPGLLTGNLSEENGSKGDVVADDRNTGALNYPRGMDAEENRYSIVSNRESKGQPYYCSGKVQEDFICKPCCGELASTEKEGRRCILCGETIAQGFEMDAVSGKVLLHVS